MGPWTPKSEGLGRGGRISDRRDPASVLNCGRTMRSSCLLRADGALPSARMANPSGQVQWTAWHGYDEQAKVFDERHANPESWEFVQKVTEWAGDSIRRET